MAQANARLSVLSDRESHVLGKIQVATRIMTLEIAFEFENHEIDSFLFSD